MYPLDQEAIIEAAAKTGKVLLVTEDNKEGSIMSEVAAIIAEHCLFDLDAPIQRLSRTRCTGDAICTNNGKVFYDESEKVKTRNS